MSIAWNKQPPSAYLLAGGVRRGHGAMAAFAVPGLCFRALW
jgi:hypothetical protein